MISAFGIEHGEISKIHPGLLALGPVAGFAVGAGLNERARRKKNKQTGLKITPKEQYRSIKNHPSRKPGENTYGKKAWGE